jgi:hypothetical protein
MIKQRETEHYLSFPSPKTGGVGRKTALNKTPKHHIL